MAVDIILSVTGQPVGDPGESLEFDYSIIEIMPPVVGLAIANTENVEAYLWEILNQPPNATSTLSSAISPTPTFTPTVEEWGTYLIRCTILRSGSLESNTIGLSFDTPKRDMRFPASGEKIEFSSRDGWALAERTLYEIVDNLELGSSLWVRNGTVLSPLTSGDIVNIGSGSPSTPAYSFESDSDTGLYIPTDGTIGISTGGSPQIFISNIDGNPTIKGDGSHAMLKIVNQKTTSSGYSQLAIEALGHVSNSGSLLYLTSDGTAGGKAEINIRSIAPNSGILISSDSGVTGTQSNLYIESVGNSSNLLDISCDSTGADNNSVLNIIATSALKTASLTLGVSGDADSILNLGNSTTKSISIKDYNFEISDIIWANFLISKSASEWNALDANYGDESLISILNYLYDNIGGGGGIIEAGTGIRIDSGIEINVDDAPASEIIFDEINSPPYYNLQHYLSFVQGPTKVSGGIISDNGGGTINITEGYGIVKSENSALTPTYFVKWSALNDVALTNNDVNYVFCIYHATTPYLNISTSFNDVYLRNGILLGIVKREGSIVNILNIESISNDLNYKLHKKSLEKNMGPEYGNGIILAGTGTRQLIVSAGVMYFGLSRFTISSFDSSGTDEWTSYHTTDSGATWAPITHLTQIDNVYYNDITSGLVALTTDEFGLFWVYYNYSGDQLYVLYGTDSYDTFEAADLVGPPVLLPWQLSEFSFLIGKVIVQEGENAIDVTSIFIDDIGGGSSTNFHNTLPDLQGGAATEYYHLNLDDYTDLIDNLPIDHGAIVYGNADGELSHNDTNLLFLEGEVAQAKHVLKGTTSATSTFKSYSTGDTLFEIIAESTISTQAVISIKTTSGSGDCEYKQDSMHKFYMDSEELLQIDRVTSAASDTRIKTPVSIGDRSLFIVNAQENGYAYTSLSSITTNDTAPANIDLISESISGSGDASIGITSNSGVSNEAYVNLIAQDSGETEVSSIVLKTDYATSVTVAIQSYSTQVNSISDISLKSVSDTLATITADADYMTFSDTTSIRGVKALSHLPAYFTASFIDGTHQLIIDWKNSNYQKVTLTSNCTSVTLLNPHGTADLYIRISAEGATRSLTGFSANVSWFGAYNLTTGSTSISTTKDLCIHFHYAGSGIYEAWCMPEDKSEVNLQAAYNGSIPITGGSVSGIHETNGALYLYKNAEDSASPVLDILQDHDGSDWWDYYSASIFLRGNSNRESVIVSHTNNITIGTIKSDGTAAINLISQAGGETNNAVITLETIIPGSGAGYIDIVSDWIDFNQTRLIDLSVATYGGSFSNASYASGTVTVNWATGNKAGQEVNATGNITALSMTAPEGAAIGLSLIITAIGGDITIGNITNVSWVEGSDLSSAAAWTIPEDDFLVISLMYRGAAKGYIGWISPKAIEILV